MLQKWTWTLPSSLTRFEKQDFPKYRSALYKEGRESMSSRTTNKCTSDVIFLKNLIAKASDLWKLSVLPIIRMPRTASPRRQGHIGTWLEEWAKKLYTKLQLSWLMQTYKNQAQKYSLHYECGCTHSSHQHLQHRSEGVKLLQLSPFNR